MRILCCMAGSDQGTNKTLRDNCAHKLNPMRTQEGRWCTHDAVISTVEQRLIEKH